MVKPAPDSPKNAIAAFLAFGLTLPPKQQGADWADGEWIKAHNMLRSQSTDPKTRRAFAIQTMRQSPKKPNKKGKKDASDDHIPRVLKAKLVLLADKHSVAQTLVEDFEVAYRPDGSYPLIRDLCKEVAAKLSIDL